MKKVSKSSYFTGSIIYVFLLLSFASHLDVYAQTSNRSLAFKRRQIFYRDYIVPPSMPSAYWLQQRFDLMRAANAGDPNAQHELGLRFLTGEGFDADTSKALYWVYQAATKLHVSAKYNLGIFLLNGWGVAWDPFEAFDNFLFAAERGMPQAQYVVGIIYTENLIVPKDLYTAYAWIKKSTEKGFEPAEEVLLKLEERGITVSADSIDLLAEQSFKPDTANQTAENDTSESLKYLDFSKDSIPRLTDSRLVEQFLVDGGDSSVTDIGLTLQQEQLSLENDSALQNLQKLGETGNPDALVLLGRFYEEGRIIEKDLIKAAAFYVRAIRLNSPFAPLLFYNILQIEDFYTSLKREAFAGNTDASYVYASLSLLDVYYDVNLDNALSMLKKNADKGHIPSLLTLGASYFSGNYFALDRSEALDYLSTAADMGCGEAKVRIVMDMVYNKQVKPDVIKPHIDFLFEMERSGSILAQLTLGKLYEDGYAADGNKSLAAKYYRKAAIRGNAVAYHSLFSLYDRKRPVDERFQISTPMQ